MRAVGLFSWLAASVYLTPELKTLLSAQVERIKALERRLGRIIPWLFPHLPAVHISPRLVGTQRKDFRKAWATACKLAGVPGAIRHDFRRTAVRNMVQRGRARASRYEGHRAPDRSVFDRYHIISPADLKDRTGTIAVTIGRRRNCIGSPREDWRARRDSNPRPSA